MRPPSEDPDFPGYDADGGDAFDVEFLRRRVQEDPSDWKRWLRLGFLLDRDSADEATPVLERAVALAPGNGLTHYLLARARFRAADRAGAKDALEAAVRLRPDYENAWRLLGLMRFEDGRFDAAQKALSRAARLVPDGETYWAIARCFVAMRDFAEAMVALEEAVRLKPNHTVAHRALAMLGRYRGESDVEHRHLLQLFVLDEGMARELEKEFNGESPDGT